jgi:phytoene desaturase
MSEAKSAVIIGAGIGGIATSIFLAKKGFKVKIFEKNAAPGGRCSQTIRDGHRFDLGATIFLMPSIYKKVFNSLDLTLEDSFQIVPLPVIYKVYFDDGNVLAFSTESDRMQAQLESIEPGSFKNFQSYITQGYKSFQLAMSHLLGRNFYSLFEFVNFKNARLLFRIKTHIRHTSFVSRFFKNPHLKMAFTFQNIYVGQDPQKAPALFSMLPAVELTEGSLFTIGGMYSVVEKLLSTAISLGVEFHFNKTVRKIVLKKNKTEGILLEDGTEINADVIIANADLPYVYRELLPDKKISRRLDRLKYSCSAIVFHWGLDKVYSQLGHHSVFLSEQYRNNLDKIFNEKSISGDPSFYIHAPVRSDPTAAPPDQDTLSIIVPVGHIDEKQDQNWNKLKLIVRSAVIDRLKRAGLFDIEEHIKFEICYLPNTWKNMYNITYGSVFGSVNHSVMQMGYFRPHNRHKRYKNLYFVGGSTHPGNGIPLVLLSSELTSERILKESSGN